MDYRIAHMSDETLHGALYRIAEQQAGYFTAKQALEAGISRTTLRHHALDGGRFIRVRTGLYRLRYFPTSLNEHIMIAWLPLKDAGAVVSHASALHLHDLSDVIPSHVHLTLPRAQRGQRRRPGVQLHTTSHFPECTSVRTVDGMAVTSVERSIVDALAEGVSWEQIGLAVEQATERGVTTPARIVDAAHFESERVRRLVADLVVSERP